MAVVGKLFFLRARPSNTHLSFIFGLSINCLFKSPLFAGVDIVLTMIVVRSNQPIELADEYWPSVFILPICFCPQPPPPSLSSFLFFAASGPIFAWIRKRRRGIGGGAIFLNIYVFENSALSKDLRSFRSRNVVFWSTFWPIIFKIQPLKYWNIRKFIHFWIWLTIYIEKVLNAINALPTADHLFWNK